MLQSLKNGKLKQNIAEMTSSNLPPQQEVLRALALLLIENKNEISEAVTLLLSTTAENRHFREKVSDSPYLIVKTTYGIRDLYKPVHFSVCRSSK